MFQCFVDVVEIERLGIESIAEPFKHFLMVFVLRVFQRIEQVLVAPWPAAVLGRAGAAAFDAAWVMGAGFRREGLLDFQIVFPAVTEIVIVSNSVALIR